jgi:hypothetical protein
VFSCVKYACEKNTSQGEKRIDRDMRKAHKGCKETQTRITAMTSKYAEIIARRKAEREADEDQPLRFKLVRTVDGGVSLRRAA